MPDCSLSMGTEAGESAVLVLVAWHPEPQALLTISRAEASGCRDRGECGAAVHSTEVMLHVGAHIRVGSVEGGLARASGVWG